MNEKFPGHLLIRIHPTFSSPTLDDLVAVWAELQLGHKVVILANPGIVNSIVGMMKNHVDVTTELVNLEEA